MAILDSELDRLSEEFLSIPLGIVRNLNVLDMFITVDSRIYPPIIAVDGKQVELESMLEKIKDPKDFLKSLVASRGGELSVLK
ncbi:MAG: hypothetical protein V1645_01545 [archaeon]